MSGRDLHRRGSGNSFHRQGKVITVFCCRLTSKTNTESGTESYVYDDGDKLDKTTVGGVTVKDFGYDAAGRTTSVVTSAGTTTLAYDYEDRLTGIAYPNSSTNSFAYNGLDTRVGKTDSTGTKTYRRDGAYVTDPVLSDGSSTFTPGLSVRTGTVSKFQHADRLGSDVRQTSASQSVASNVRWDAFGMLASQSGTQSGPFGFAGDWGYQQDGDSGLTLLGHRYYDTSTGRFLTRDPVKDGRNWYAYCHNNPLKWVDPEGLVVWIPLIVMVFVIAAGTAEAPMHPGDHSDPAENGGKKVEAAVEAGGYASGVVGFFRNMFPKGPSRPVAPSKPRNTPKKGGRRTAVG
jgi:RHS repeat-associated protein